MRIRYNFNEYKNSPLATLLSKVAGIITSIVLMASGLFGFAVISLLYEGLFEKKWNPEFWLYVLIFFLCIAIVVFIDKIIHPAIGRIARKDDEKVAKGIKRPQDY